MPPRLLYSQVVESCSPALWCLTQHGHRSTVSSHFLDLSEPEVSYSQPQLIHPARPLLPLRRRGMRGVSACMAAFAHLDLMLHQLPVKRVSWSSCGYCCLAVLLACAQAPVTSGLSS
mmetsp:Transcript_4361/g.9444  ORF Transcript_4361/g.9444 Transcript_4361/m.9444 type:complete len:117 (+) Transcript_4361:195-545(+)